MLGIQYMYKQKRSTIDKGFLIFEMFFDICRFRFIFLTGQCKKLRPNGKVVIAIE